MEKSKITKKNLEKISAKKTPEGEVLSKKKKRSDSHKPEKELRKKKRRKLSKEEIRLRQKVRRRKNIIEIIQFFVPILLMAIIVFLFILKTSPHMVDGESMAPTLKNGDRVIVRKTQKVNRYEVITFTPPVDSKFQYVKRIIGMPGDVIWFDENYLFINQQTDKIPENSIVSTNLPDGTLKLDISKFCAEQLNGLKKIPAGSYFVLGDNRGNSSDSREFGLVKSSSIEGVVSFRFAPFNKVTWIK